MNDNEITTQLVTIHFLTNIVIIISYCIHSKAYGNHAKSMVGWVVVIGVMGRSKFQRICQVYQP